MMARYNARSDIFGDDEDGEIFVDNLGRVCVDDLDGASGPGA